MPGIPFGAQAPDFVCNCSCSRGADQMCRQGSHVRLSPEEEIEAEESLSVYCKPVELYNILQRRAVKNPSFLQRCLRYKIQAKHNRRMLMTISLLATLNDRFQVESMFPLYVLLARTVTDFTASENPIEYRFRRACVVTAFTEVKEAKFVLPETNKLSEEVRSGSLSILFVSCAGQIKDIMDTTPSRKNAEGHGLLGKISMELFPESWDKSPDLGFTNRKGKLSTVNMQSCFLKLRCMEEEKYLSVQMMTQSQATSLQLQAMIVTDEVGSKERTPYELFRLDGVPPHIESHVLRVRAGNVIFNYRYYNNKLQRTEVTEDFSCPFCLVKCASFKGLQCHLPASHQLFKFEFWVNADYQIVNVSVDTDMWGLEFAGGGEDPKLNTFSFCCKPLRRRQPKSTVQNARHVHPLVFDSDLPASINGPKDKADGGLECETRDASSPNVTGVSSGTAHSYADRDSFQSLDSLPGSNLAAPAMLQFAKTRKLSVERSDPRCRALLQKRQFYHSHRAQPMALEQVLSDRDSEDEVDDDVADFEDRRMLDDFVDITKNEKQVMHLWNSLIRKQRVLADGHINWACEAFTGLHGRNLVRVPALVRCWQIFMIKLWSHGLLDPRTMDACNKELSIFAKEEKDRMRS